MLRVVYAVSFMVSVPYKPIMLSIVMLSVVAPRSLIWRNLNLLIFLDALPTSKLTLAGVVTYFVESATAADRRPPI
jgi:hypothetical protein